MEHISTPNCTLEYMHEHREDRLGCLFQAATPPSMERERWVDCNSYCCRSECPSNRVCLASSRPPAPEPPTPFTPVAPPQPSQPTVKSSTATASSVSAGEDEVSSPTSGTPLDETTESAGKQVRSPVPLLIAVVVVLVVAITFLAVWLARRGRKRGVRAAGRIPSFVRSGTPSHAQRQSSLSFMRSELTPAVSSVASPAPVVRKTSIGSPRTGEKRRTPALQRRRACVPLLCCRFAVATHDPVSRSFSLRLVSQSGACALRLPGERDSPYLAACEPLRVSFLFLSSTPAVPRVSRGEEANQTLAPHDFLSLALSLPRLCTSRLPRVQG